MDNKYKRSQEYIRTTPEMEVRVLSRVAENTGRTGKKPIFRQLTALAACAVIAVCGISLLPRFMNGQTKLSLGEIQGSVGFSISAPTAMPDGFEIADYSSSDNSVSINYRNGESEIVYSMTAESANISSVGSGETGTDSEFPLDHGEPKYFYTDDNIVTLYGSSGKYTYGEWYDGGYRFSLRSSEPRTAEEMIAIIQSVTE